MAPQTDYIRPAARLGRQAQADAALNGAPGPDAELFRVLAKGLEVVAGLAQVGKRE